MFKSVSFRIADEKCAAKFSHFVETNGYVVVCQLDVEIALVGVIANSSAYVTDEQRAAIACWSASATKQNPDVVLSFGAGLSPFIEPVKIIEHA